MACQTPFASFVHLAPPPPSPAPADGCLKAWDADSLEIVVDRASAHGGERVHCLAMGPDGLLYTGGDDKVGGGNCAGWAGLRGVAEGAGRAYIGRLLRSWQAARSRTCSTCRTCPCSPLLTSPHLALLYSVQLVRRWDPSLLQPAAEPLLCHNHSVRTLAAGARELLVSGDKGGEVAVWKV